MLTAHAHVNDRTWLEVHDELTRLAKRRARSEWEEGHALLSALDAGVHRQLGFGSFFEYVETLFGYKARSTDEKLRVARALKALPALDEDLRAGAFNWSTIRELTRVATAPTEGAWRQAAQGKSVRQIEELVSGRKLGDKPDSPADPALRRHMLAFEVRAETFATVREAFAKLRRNTPEPLDEETALLLMARHVLGGPADDGRSSYQLALTVCEQCGRSSQRGHGREVEVDSAIRDMALCDAQQIGHLDHINARDVVNPNGSAHVGQPRDRHSPHQRASQTIPPATRRLVLHRNGRRCAVPGCRNASFLDVYHLQPRSEGGCHDSHELVVLCAAHHRALHRGRLIAEGTRASDVKFRHADGSSYGIPRSAKAVATHAHAFVALRKLGFRETEVRQALARVRAEMNDARDAEQVLRAALRELTPSSATAHQA